ncbi:cytochrome P450 [Talaromyces pinophilus]|uniref:Cytochrome P450 n=1 Tax=Talaromyces pinophilus TaxID=128442 RepID=A0A6V8H8Z3_TALPI|nr:cytochrome P450 [Talaromyces pinophilus]
MESLAKNGIELIRLDPTDPESISLARADVAKATGGKLDILVNNAISIAGSEPSATLLSGCIYFLTKIPNAMEQLSRELCTTFSKSSDVTAAKCSQLKYLNAVIEETLHLYPPVVASLPRIVPKGGGDFIDGKAVPENTVVSIYHHASYHANANFALTEKFHPK